METRTASPHSLHSNSFFCLHESTPGPRRPPLPGETCSLRDANLCSVRASTINAKTVKRTAFLSRGVHALSSGFSRSEKAFPRSWWLFHANSRSTNFQAIFSEQL